MDSFSRTIRDIESVKIQGAENVAIAAINAFKTRIKTKRYSGRERLLSDVEKSKKLLFKTRPTEPLMRNSLDFVTHGIGNYSDSGVSEIKKMIILRADKALAHFKEAEEKIALYGSRRIEEGYVVFTHCHSSSVINIFSSARKQGKWFRVYNTETRPLYQGRKTANDCVRLKIPVTMFVDSAARVAIKKSDIMMIGSDAMTAEGRIVNKIGSEMFAVIANKYDVPVYVCMDSWKFDPKSITGYDEEIEQRSSKEIWPKKPKGVRIENPTFERVLPDLITGIISDIGLYPPEVFVEEVKKSSPWMFE
ncbi:MAG: S-methyl-5-thioribose-1-phosphate isomerase [Candidatus Aenigmarchaeota archaeon]|nr:S-methyl-5-thioribose-1-phosphate isomerase [Candidatus Aenigmarchaeota archaeon]